jgi:hypothetical protein
MQKRMQRKAGTPAPLKERELEEVSVFGGNAGQLLQSCLLECKNDKADALIQFVMEHERSLRIMKAPNSVKKGDWGDAGNVMSPVFTKDYKARVVSGEVVGQLTQNLEASRGYSNYSERKTLVEVYIAARNRLFNNERTSSGELPKLKEAR